MKSFLCELILSCTLVAPGAKPIDDLSYGQALYHYYQEQHSAALLDILVAESRQRIGENPVRFELAKGSFAFSDGLYALSEKTFANVNPAELTDLDRMRLDFHLAREAHRRGDWEHVERSLADIDLGKNWRGRQRFHPEVEYMRADLYMYQGDLISARAALNQLEPGDKFRAYGLFNLGVAEHSRDRLSEAYAIFDELAETKAFDNEAFDLIQRARLAQSYIARQQPDLQKADAESLLGVLPGSGRYRDLALAAYGGIAMSQEAYELAARIWLTLQKQEYWNAATATARLGFPMSLEHLTSRNQALVQYRVAEASFESRLTALDGLRQQVQQPEWVRELLKAFSSPDPDDAAMGELMQSWQQALGHTDWLEWLATEDVHQLLADWRELNEMKSWLNRLPEQLDAFSEVAEERRRRGKQARFMLLDERLLDARDQLNHTIAEQSETLTQLRQTTPEPEASWMRQIANNEQRVLYDRLQKMESLLEKHDKGAKPQHLSARIDRLQGRLFFDLVLGTSTRLRQLEKQLSENQTLVKDLDQRIQRVQSAEAEFVAGAEADFLRFDSRARKLIANVDKILDERETMLAGEIQRGMDREVKQVQQYLLITRIAIARTTDQLALQETTR